MKVTEVFPMKLQLLRVDANGQQKCDAVETTRINIRVWTDGTLTPEHVAAIASQAFGIPEAVISVQSTSRIWPRGETPAFALLGVLDSDFIIATELHEDAGVHADFYAE